MRRIFKTVTTTEVELSLEEIYKAIRAAAGAPPGATIALLDGCCDEMHQLQRAVVQWESLPETEIHDHMEVEEAPSSDTTDPVVPAPPTVGDMLRSHRQARATTKHPASRRATPRPNPREHCS